MRQTPMHHPEQVASAGLVMPAPLQTQSLDGFPCFRAIGTPPPECDLRLFDLVPRRRRGRQARRLADHAVDVDGLAAIATDEMVVVVADARLEQRRGSGWRDAANDARPMEGTHDVVNRLRRKRTDPRPGSLGDLIHAHVSGHLRKHSEHRQAGGRHPKAVCTQDRDAIDGGRH